MKHVFQRLEREKSFKILTKKVIQPDRRGSGQSPRAQRENARCREARRRPGRDGECVMTDYHTVKRIDNTRLVRHAAPARLRDFWRLCAAVGGAIAACLLFYAWQHFECIQIRYQVAQLESQRAKAVQLNQQLHLEVASLRSPMRVDTIARNQLGLDGSGARASGSGRRAERRRGGAGASPLPQTPRP